jgi:hypothetical protein
MTHLIRRIATLVLTAAVLATATAAGARAGVACTAVDFSPRSVTVGLSAVPVTFQPKMSGCAPAGWSLEGGDYAFFADDTAPSTTFAPLRNGETQPLDVVVSVYDADHDEQVRSFPQAFVLKRGTTWDGFNASPEPVRKGAKITIKGRLRMADWEKRSYVGYPSRTAAVEFRTIRGSYRRVATARTGSGGYLSTTVTAAGDGFWRLRYGGNSTAGASTVAGDFVDVR